MRKKTHDVFDVLAHLQDQIVKKTPTSRAMWDEVRMMQFKVRPLYGDISFINLKNKNLIEIIWRLGKLDDIFQKKYDSLDEDQKAVFFRMIDSLHEQLQAELNKVDLKRESTPQNQPSLEMEIFKEKATQKRLN